MSDARTSTDRDETPDERADRNMNELLQELRVALPGVQVLFALLIAPQRVPPAQLRGGAASSTSSGSRRG
jgi:hypothetical protein